MSSSGPATAGSVDGPSALFRCGATVHDVPEARPPTWPGASFRGNCHGRQPRHRGRRLHGAARARPVAALDDRGDRAVRPIPRVVAAHRADRSGEPSRADLPDEAGAHAAAPGAAPLGGRPRLRPELAPPPGAGASWGRLRGGARLRPDRRDDRLRPRTTAVGVHAAGGSSRGPRGARDEGAPLVDRRHRRGVVGRARRRPHSGARGPARCARATPGERARRLGAAPRSAGPRRAPAGRAGRRAGPEHAGHGRRRAARTGAHGHERGANGRICRQLRAARAADQLAGDARASASLALRHPRRAHRRAASGGP